MLKPSIGPAAGWASRLCQIATQIPRHLCRYTIVPRHHWVIVRRLESKRQRLQDQRPVSLALSAASPAQPEEDSDFITAQKEAPVSPSLANTAVHVHEASQEPLQTCLACDGPPAPPRLTNLLLFWHQLLMVLQAAGLALAAGIGVAYLTTRPRSQVWPAPPTWHLSALETPTGCQPNTAFCNQGAVHAASLASPSKTERCKTAHSRHEMSTGPC